MSLPIPSGTRDVLPDENRELRAITDAWRTSLEAAGYGEIATPALEYESVLAQGGVTSAQPAYRVVDDHGDALVLRSDMTVPIARVIGTRYADAPVPLRFWYLGPAYRQIRPKRGMSREMLQVGIELAGAPGISGTAEALTVLCDGLTAIGLRDFRLAVGDASLFPTVLEAEAVAAEQCTRILYELGTHDYVGLRRELGMSGMQPALADQLLELAQRRGGPEVFNDTPSAAADVIGELQALYAALPGIVAERVIFDLGLVRDLDYYTGPVFEVYDPALGVPLGGGGRYDDLLGRLGRPLAAVGFALTVERLHLALYGEQA